MDQEYKSQYAHKPSSSHPWKRGVNTAVSKWAKEKADVTPVNNVRVARPETLSKNDTRRRGLSAK